MIHVLIVDDDNLVRKGLITAMPWDDFGMRIAGEAANGEKALEFLASHRVELLITDLAMPVMSGIELLRTVRERYPDLAVAVLTLHQDFEYIQEALRLGAIDYIAKVQLEKEHFGEVLGRIRARIVAGGSGRTKESDAAPQERFPGGDAYALLALREQAEPEAVLLPAEGEGCWRADIDSHVRLWLPASELTRQDLTGYGSGGPSVQAEALPPEWRMVRVRHAAGESVAELQLRLNRYRQQDFFYDCDGGKKLPIELDLEQLRAERTAPSEREIEETQDMLFAFRWLHDETSFAELRRRLHALRLPAEKLMQLFYGCTVEWNRIFRSVSDARAALPDKLACWEDCAVWLDAFREMSGAASGRAHLSGEVSGSIMAAVKIVHDELALPLFAIDVAKRVNLSRSYFNQVFKEAVGYSFNEYLRKTRVDKAREYLVQTKKPIQWIAEHTGYADEKYFSRTFREQTGMLPSEYRTRHRQG
ncbi:helix-turn-helix domain-containing protein [Cohnella sp. GCM10012308]|uniref:response regulator transcription factor n=1 Tax=Cohnella sp. GCM10012308 TaxID=3317329 RepID=UPI00361D2611